VYKLYKLNNLEKTSKGKEKRAFFNLNFYSLKYFHSIQILIFHSCKNSEQLVNLNK